MIMNEVELATLANESIGSLSEETRLANDPRVDNPTKEIEKMETEKETISLGGDDVVDRKQNESSNTIDGETREETN